MVTFFKQRETYTPEETRLSECFGLCPFIQFSQNSTYIDDFDCFDKYLIVLSAASGGISIASFATVIGVPIGLASASFSFAFSLTTGIVKKLLKATRN